MVALLPIADLNGPCEYIPGDTFDCGPLYAYISSGVSITDGGVTCHLYDDVSYCES